MEIAIVNIGRFHSNGSLLAVSLIAETDHESVKR